MKEMKDSSVLWIGTIPKDWGISRVKHAFTRKNEKAHQENPIVLSLARSGVRIRDLSNNEGQIAESYNDYNPVSVGDLLLNPMDLYSGANCSISCVDGVISPAYVNLRYKEGIADPRYYDYYFKTQYWAMAMFAHGKGVSFDNRWTLGIDTLFNYYIPAPSFDEQRRIAAFLDAKCAEIDSILEKTRASIEEYKKLKQSVITEAVTKGIRGERPMKDSGEEWIGEIPSDWEVLKNSLLFRENVRSPKPEDISLSLSQEDGLIPTEDMKESSLKTSTYEGWKRVHVGDLVLNRFKAHLGVFFSATLEGIVSFHYGVFEPQVELSSKYFEYLCHSEPYRAIYANKSNGMVVGLQNLSNQNFYSVKSLFPTLAEQQEIAAYLDEKCAAIDSLVASKESLMKELEDYKKSLIYEYVTGKKEV